MAKLYYKKVGKCSDCPNSFRHQMGPQHDYCLLTDKSISINIPEWCPLIDYMERIEANETENVWLKIKGK